MAKTKGYCGILEGTNTETPENNEAPDIITNHFQNEIDYSHLMGLLDGVSYDIIETCATNVNPSGNACVAWKHLVAKYEPSSHTSLIDLFQEFSLCTYMQYYDPDKWFSHLGRIKHLLHTRHNHHTDDEDMKAHILNNLPTEYNDLRTILCSQASTITLLEIQYQIREY